MLKLLLSALVLVVVGCSHKGNPVQVQQRPVGSVSVLVVLGGLDSAIFTAQYAREDLSRYFFSTSVKKDTLLYIIPNNAPDAIPPLFGVLVQAVCYSHDFYNGVISEKSEMWVISDTTWRL
jgi:hypothetical protein